jgi:Fe-Mn family superoxide dismutase
MFILPDLPYDCGALEPIVSRTTLQFHHDKHHAAYVKKASELAREANLIDRPLEEVVREARTRNLPALFNNAAQAWNHAFFWESMAPTPPRPDGALGAAIDDEFGSLEGLRKRFIAEGVGHFGSGWVWLVYNGQLDVISTHDAEDMLTRDGISPLLVCDLWEHAYYLDYKNDRLGFLTAWYDGLANWSFAEQQFDAVHGAGQAFTYPGSP